METLLEISLPLVSKPPASLIILSTMPKYAKSPDMPLGKCGFWATYGNCEDCGAQYAVRHVCSKEWCPECGQFHSIAHNRRIRRWLAKIRTFESVGYWVIAFPHDENCPRSKAELSERRKQVMSVFARTERNPDGLYDNGLSRFHYFGDVKNGKTPVYHPHLNILVGGGHYDKRELRRVKELLRDATGIPSLVVHYSYKTTPARMMHCLSYVTRATFLNEEWDGWLAHDLYRFHNSQCWGQWAGRPDKWGEQLGQEDETARVEKGICPACGGKILWDKKIAWWSEVAPIGYEWREFGRYIYAMMLKDGC